jgi:hypothetical protein
MTEDGSFAGPRHFFWGRRVVRDVGPGGVIPEMYVVDLMSLTF